MIKKLLFYQNYGVEEYYIYDPNTLEFIGSQRVGDRLEEIAEINGWVSPRSPLSKGRVAGWGKKFTTHIMSDRLTAIKA